MREVSQLYWHGGVDAVESLGDKVGLVLKRVSSRLVIDLELTLRWFEPLHTFALENHSELALRVRLELLHGVQAVLKPTEQIFRHIALVRWRHAKVQCWFFGLGRVG